MGQRARNRLLAEMPDNFLHCRSMGHHFRRVTMFKKRHIINNALRMVVVEESHCPMCVNEADGTRAKRHVYLDPRTFQVLGRSYPEYPTGYIINESGRTTRADARKVSFTRELNGAQEHAPSKSKPRHLKAV